MPRNITVNAYSKTTIDTQLFQHADRVSISFTDKE